MEKGNTNSCSRDRVKRHRSRRKIEAEMQATLRNFTGVTASITSNTENLDNEEGVVVRDRQEITRSLPAADALDGLDTAVDIDMDQEIVENIQQADAPLGSDVSDDICMDQETTIDIQQLDAQLGSDISVDRSIDPEMTLGTPAENSDFQIAQHSAEHDNDSIDSVGIKEDVVQELRHWAIQSNIQQNHLDKLLKILRKELIPTLPKSSKTFLETSSIASYHIRVMEDDGIMNTPGQFVYFGIESGLQRCINHEIHSDIIELIFNIDGLPISNSSAKCVWPILCKPHYRPDIYSPFPVAIYLGMSKPKNLVNYLQQFIQEINDLQKIGVIISGRSYEVRLKCFVADTPARAYLKCCKCHGGFSACERCVVRGRSESTGKGSTVAYQGIDHEQRTDESFRQQKDPEHHTGTTPLLAIKPEPNMISICLLDMMHLLSGVVKKMILSWMKGLRRGSREVRLSPSQKHELDRRLLYLQRQVPCEFQRKPRSVFDVPKWKATEFRFFLLYSGPIVLKSILPTNIYKHFLLLHVAFRILCSDELALTHNALAKKCLQKFVLALPLLYSPASLVINMHNLVHIADDAMNMGCSLSRINCFPFENALGALKKKLRTPNRPLAQLCRRYAEQNSLGQQPPSLPPVLKICKSCKENSTITIVRSLEFHSMFLTCAIPNNMVLLKDGTVMQLDKIWNEGTTTISSLMIRGKIWKVKKLVYDYPKKSKSFGLWELNEPSGISVSYSLTEVKQKLVRLQLALRKSGSKRLFVASLLHA